MIQYDLSIAVRAVPAPGHFTSKPLTARVISKASVRQVMASSTHQIAAKDLWIPDLMILIHAYM